MLDCIVKQINQDLFNQLRIHGHDQYFFGDADHDFVFRIPFHNVADRSAYAVVDEARPVRETVGSEIAGATPVPVFAPDL